jgi:hypothetical protein
VGATLVAFLALAAALGPTAQADGTRVLPIIDNERVTVWDVTTARGLPDSRSLASGDLVVVSLAPRASAGRVSFVKRGTARESTLMPNGSARTAIVLLKDHFVAPLRNTSGYPLGFPRPGNNRKVLENSRIVVWDYTFVMGEPTPMHFHDKDVVTCYLEEGTVAGTTPDGQTTPNPFTAGTVRFNPRNRTHTETLVKGRSHIIAIELK